MNPGVPKRDTQEPASGGVEQSTAVVFGAGNVGKGLLAELFQDAGLRTVFVEENHAVVASLRRERSYTLRLHSRRDVLTRVISSFEICRPGEPMTRDALRRADVCATAVGADNLQAVAPHIARACEERDRTTWNVLVCENRCDGAQILAEHVQAHLSGNRTRTPGIVQCSVERMVGRSAETESGEISVDAERWYPLFADEGPWRGDRPAWPAFSLSRAALSILETNPMAVVCIPAQGESAAAWPSSVIRGAEEFSASPASAHLRPFWHVDASRSVAGSRALR